MQVLMIVRRLNDVVPRTWTKHDATNVISGTALQPFQTLHLPTNAAMKVSLGRTAA